MNLTTILRWSGRTTHVRTWRGPIVAAVTAQVEAELRARGEW